MMQQFCRMLRLTLCDEPSAAAVVEKAGMHHHLWRGSHHTVRLGDKVTTLPIHGGKQDMPTGTVNGIKKALGLLPEKKSKDAGSDSGSDKEQE
jgi:predicted RNA binding protein YcfA (HicA-like mRNA interferase family)